MKYYLIAGEASGDLHGANLMHALKQKDAQAEFRYFGGDKMQAQGGTLVKHYAEMAFMGFTEVLLNLRTIFANLKKCKADLMAYQPDALVLIDYPGFNLKIAEFAKAQGLKVFYYISPKVWAWNQKRVLKLRKVVDKMFCILPFEVEFYKRWNFAVDYVGNPLLDEIAGFRQNEHFRRDNGLSEKEIIALLPGSRKQEIELLLPEMLKMVTLFPQYEFVVAGAPVFDSAYYEKFLHSLGVKIVFNETYNLLAHAHAAVVASGTATLETALFKVPQVVVYKGGAITIAIARMLIKIKYISLVNLIADKKIVTELIQQDLSQRNLQRELEQIIGGHGRMTMLQDYALLEQLMGEPGASVRAADLILTTLDA